MNDLRSRVRALLPFVQEPIQYVGGEWNAVVKDHASVDVSVALAFPDTYAIGMSHLGLQILYSILNARPDVAAERVYAPWTDMEAQMRKAGMPLYALESFTPLRDFDLVGFSLQHEMCYTNVLNMLDLAGIPLRSAERGSEDPLVIAGGPCAIAPEPVADFIDLFLLGDGEERIVDLVETYKRLKNADPHMPRKALITEMAKSVPSLYAPTLYSVEHNPDGTVRSIRPTTPGIPETVRAAFVKDLDAAPYPTRPVVPFLETVHDRISLEIMRGCTHGCRFCQAGMMKRPSRARTIPTLLKFAEETYKHTGYSEISLASLSSSDYPDIQKLIREMHAAFENRHVNVSLPSMRVNDQLALMPALLKTVRKSGLTIAPEAARQELRRVINKNIDNSHLYEAVEEAYRQGWNLVKLYFMVGLPTETDEDVDAIADMMYHVSNLRRQTGGSPGRVNATIATFVPKPHTPFQWEPMTSLERVEEIQRRLRSKVKRRDIWLKFHRADRSFLEGVFARGDRRLAEVLLAAWRSGSKFDSWDEHFSFQRWMDAFRSVGVDPSFYALRPRPDSEVFPWDHLTCGVSRQFLQRERQRALQGETTADCRVDKCCECGACVATPT